MGHQVKTSDLQTFECKQQIAAAFGNGEHKSLNIKTFITTQNKIVSQFTVEERYKEIYTSDHLDIAIRVYNDIK